MHRRSALTYASAPLLAAFLPAPLWAQDRKGLRGYVRTNWSQDPFAFGSYSYNAKSARRRDRQTLRRPIGNKLFFAGEAVHPDYNSTVHAAYESGLQAADAVQAEEGRSVAIIGAGISGLAAAHQLAAVGHIVTVFEARDRIGGRIWTDTRLSQPLDLGASWIHGINDNPIARLAAQLNIGTVPTDDSYIIRGGHGQLLSDAESPDWLEDVVTLQHGLGADADQINTLSYWLADDYDGNEVVFPDGYSQIFAGLQADYDLRMSTKVVRVSTASPQVEIVTADGQAQSFDAAICTLPLGVLKQQTVTFDPPLPEDKQGAIQRIGFGTLDKLYLLFDSRFWDPNVTWIATPDNNLPQGQFNQWLNFDALFGAPILMAFNGGTPALDLAELDDETLLDRALNTLESSYPS